MILGGFYSQPVVFTTSEAELITTIIAALAIASFVASVLTWWRQSRCQQIDCRYELRGRKLPLRRRGKYPHGHVKLCHVHHPHVPNDGKITAEHIQKIGAH